MVFSFSRIEVLSQQSQLAAPQLDVRSHTAVTEGLPLALELLHSLLHLSLLLTDAPELLSGSDLLEQQVKLHGVSILRVGFLERSL